MSMTLFMSISLVLYCLAFIYYCSPIDHLPLILYEHDTVHEHLLGALLSGIYLLLLTC
jgi:hypothetical protein